jgi:hypothetical protein
MKSQGVSGAIMQFQTDKNGTFAPTINTASGTAKWEIDGVEYITNTPSVALTGTVVDVKVYPFSIPVAEDLLSINFDDQNILGDINLSYFTVNGSIACFNNPGLNNILLNPAYSNVITQLTANISGLDSVQVENALISGGTLRLDDTDISSLNFSNLNNIVTSAFVGNNNLLNVDLTKVLVNGSLDFRLNTVNFLGVKVGSLLTSVNFFNTPSLQTVNLSNATINGNVNGYTCPAMTSLVFSSSGNTSNGLALDVNNLLPSLDLSGFTCGGRVAFNRSPNLVTLIPPTFAAGIYNISGYNCALNETSVNAILSKLNSDLTSTPPTSNLDLRLEGGTNSSPTGGDSNADLENLRDVIFPGSGFTFTYAIN